MKGKAVVLLSGGLDSATALYLAREEGFCCDCLVFDYGQLHRREIRSARMVARAAGCACKVVKIKFPWKGSALLDRKMRLPPAGMPRGIPDTYVPARNLVFLSFAFSFAEAKKAEAVFIGAHAHDYSGYPDCRPAFFRAFQKVVAVGTRAGVRGRHIEVRAPLLHKGKAQIIRLAVRLGVPLELTWSCYRGGRVPCGECQSCYFRERGFREARVSDPLLQR